MASVRPRYRPGPLTSGYPVTPRQMEIFTFIYEYARGHGYQPSWREINEHFGISSPNGLLGSIRSLAAKGWVEPQSCTARAIRFLKRPDGAKFEGFQDKPQEASPCLPA